MLSKIVGIARECAILIVISVAYKLAVQAAHLPISGNVLGFALLAILLGTKILPGKWFNSAATILVKNMGLFFVPIAAGVIIVGESLHGAIYSYMVIVLVSTLLGLVASIFAMKTCRFFMRKKNVSKINVQREIRPAS